MEPKSDKPKLPDMVMCGDHPSFTKTELNTKDSKEDKDAPLSYNKFGPTTSSSERSGAGERAGSGERTVVAERPRLVERARSRERPRSGEQSRSGEQPRPGERRARPPSDHALRPDTRRRALDTPRAEVALGNGALVTAALGSFRWPPYLLAVWVLVLVLTHALHCIVSCMERALPCLRQVCQYFRTWAEESWRAEDDSKRIVPVGLALVTGLFYALYFALYLLYAIALWSIEPLYNEEAKNSQCSARILSSAQVQYSQEGSETKVTDYVESTKSDVSFK